MSKRVYDVCEAAIVVPHSLRGEIQDVHWDFVLTLSRQFPRFHFDVARLSPVQDRELFSMIPKMTFTTLDGETFPCRPLEPWLRAQILQSCIDYAYRNTSFRRPLTVRRSLSAARAR